MKIENFRQAQEFISGYMPEKSSQKFPGGAGLDRITEFLKLLGEPQNKLRVIHVAGTSGKGSTAYLISLLLKSQDFRTGLILSPHVVDLRERIQINNHLISKEKFIFYLNELSPFIKDMENSKYGKLTYFEILTALSFYIFWREKVDFAVVETGLGGLYDGTNVVKQENKIVVLTKIGYDHTGILGKKLSEIAYQKAGIIKQGNQIISILQTKSAEKVIKNMAEEKASKLFFVRKGINYRNIVISQTGVLFDFNFDNVSQRKLKLGLIGEHQVENASLALAVLILLSERYSFKINFEQVRQVLSLVNFIGRFDIKNIKGKKIIFDGAHNNQKIMSLVKTLKTLFNKEKFNFLLAIKKDKDYKSMLKMIFPLAEKIFITEFSGIKQDSVLRSVDPSVLANGLEKLGFKDYKIFLSVKEALNALMLKKDNKKIVITGSLYLLGEVYKKLKIKR